MRKRQHVSSDQVTMRPRIEHVGAVVLGESLEKTRFVLRCPLPLRYREQRDGHLLRVHVARPGDVPLVTRLVALPLLQMANVLIGAVGVSALYVELRQAVDDVES